MIPPFHPTDPRANRAFLQDQQAAHGGLPTEKRSTSKMPEPERAPVPDHEELIRNGLARARNPEGVARLLARAADLLRPADPAPEACDE